MLDNLQAIPADAALVGAVGALKGISTNSPLATKLIHIFDQPRHNLGGLLGQFGSKEEAFNAIQAATESIVQSQNITGVVPAREELSRWSTFCGSGVDQEQMGLRTPFVASSASNP